MNFWGYKMEALMKAFNDMFKQKDERIELLEWENKRLKAENAELKNDIEKYEENETHFVKAKGDNK